MRIDSRKRRRTRFRVTALPTRLDVMKPHRLSVSWFGLTISLTVCVDFIEDADFVEDADFALPCANTAAKSRCFFIFSVWFNPHAAASCSGFATATALLRQWLRYGERVHRFLLKPSRVGRERLTRIKRKGFKKAAQAQTVSCVRCFSRRFLSIRRPARVDMRARNPCLRSRRRTLGWYVLLGIQKYPSILNLILL